MPINYRESGTTYRVSFIHSAIASTSITAGQVIYYDGEDSVTPTVNDSIMPTGIAGNSASNGETVFVIATGTSTLHSSLTSNTVYYLQSDGTIGTSKSTYRIGRAINSTTLIVGIREV